MMAGPVLDSYALLAYLRDEPGAAAVQKVLEKAGRKGTSVLMCDVNYAEVQYITRRKNGESVWEQVSAALVSLPIEFVSTSRALADLAAHFKSRHRLSLADAFAAALARERKTDLVTGDPEFQSLKNEIKINWILD